MIVRFIRIWLESTDTYFAHRARVRFRSINNVNNCEVEKRVLHILSIKKHSFQALRLRETRVLDQILTQMKRDYNTC